MAHDGVYPHALSLVFFAVLLPFGQRWQLNALELAHALKICLLQHVAIVRLPEDMELLALAERLLLQCIGFDQAAAVTAPMVGKFAPLLLEHLDRVHALLDDALPRLEPTLAQLWEIAERGGTECGDGDEDDEDDQGIVVLEASTAAGTSSAVDKTGRIKRNLERQNRQNAMPGIISKKARKAIVRDFITSQRREAVVTSARQWQEAQREQALPPVTMADVRQWVAQSASIAHPGSERMRKVPFDCRRFFPLLTRPSGGAALVELMLSCVNRELDTVEVALAHAKAAASASSGSAKAKAEAGGRAMRHSLTAEAMEAEVMAALAEEEEDDED